MERMRRLLSERAGRLGLVEEFDAEDAEDEGSDVKFIKIFNFMKCRNDLIIWCHFEWYRKF